MVILVFLTDCEITTIQCALDDYCMYVEAARRYDLPLFSLEIDRCLHSRQGNCSSAGLQEVGKSLIQHVAITQFGKHEAVWQVSAETEQVLAAGGRFCAGTWPASSFSVE